MAEQRDEHIIEAIGRCRIVIRDGKVVEVGEAQVRDCPLAKKFAVPVSPIGKEAVKGNIEGRIRAWGMCTPRREVSDTREFVGFGASEVLSFGLKAGLIDAAVIACDGAGTVVVAKPSLVQGIGGRMSGLVKTVPYPEVIGRIEAGGGVVVDPARATLDQVAGVKRAYELGYQNIAVTVALPDDAVRIRKEYPRAFIFAVHVTGHSRSDAEKLAGASDIVTSCASGTIREIAGKKALLQAGVSVPIFAMTKRAKDLILEKIKQGSEQVLFKTTKLPVLTEKQPEPLV